MAKRTDDTQHGGRMSLESFFVMEHEKLKRELTELEKKAKGLEIDLMQKQSLLTDVARFLKGGHPCITQNGFLHISFLLGGEQKENAIELLKRLAVNIGEEVD